MKEYALSNINFGRRLDFLRKEADKCDLVCANCHRERESVAVAERLRSRLQPG